MRTSYAMMPSRVTSPIEDEGAEEAGGVTVSVRGRLSLSYASLRLTVAASMALITVKWGDSEKETENGEEAMW